MTPTLLSPRKSLLLLPLILSILCQTSSAFSPQRPCRLHSYPNQQPQISSRQRHPINENTSLHLSNNYNHIHHHPDNDNERSRPNIIKIQTHQDYIHFLQQDDRLCIIKFYASWCKSCARFGVSFRHLAYEEGDHILLQNNHNEDEEQVVHVGKVRFAEVEYSSNPKLCKTLKVKKLPTCHYYRRGEGKLSELTCKPSQFQMVVDEMNRLLDNDDVGMDAKDGGEDVTVSHDIMEGGNNNVTSSSFSSAVENLSQEIMKKIESSSTNQTMSSGGQKEKKPWFSI